MNKQIALPRIHPRFLLAALAALILAAPAWAAPLTPEEEAKTSTRIIENAKAGKPQNLIVNFEYKAITAKRLAAGPTVNPQKLYEKIQQEYAAIQAGIFPNGRLGDMEVISENHNFRLPEEVWIHVPNWQGLEQLLSHPQITAVYDRIGTSPFLITPY